MRSSAFNEAILATLERRCVRPWQAMSLSELCWRSFIPDFYGRDDGLHPENRAMAGSFVGFSESQSCHPPSIEPLSFQKSKKYDGCRRGGCYRIVSATIWFQQVGLMAVSC